MGGFHCRHDRESRRRFYDARGIFGCLSHRLSLAASIAVVQHVQEAGNSDDVRRRNDTQKCRGAAVRPALNLRAAIREMSVYATSASLPWMLCDVMAMMRNFFSLQLFSVISTRSPGFTAGSRRVT